MERSGAEWSGVEFRCSLVLSRQDKMIVALLVPQVQRVRQARVTAVFIRVALAQKSTKYTVLCVKNRKVLVHDRLKPVEG